MFDTMPETRACGHVLGKNAVSGAVFFHALILVAMTGTSLLARVEPGEPPPLPDGTVFVNDVLRFGLDLRPEGARARRPEVRKAPPAPEKPPEATQPVSIDELVDRDGTSAEAAPVADDPAADGPWTDGEGDGSGDGLGETGDGPGGGGDPRGSRDGSLTGLPPPPDPDEILVVGGPVDGPVLVRKVEPEYPSIARRAGIQGAVVLEGVIGTDGRIESLTVIRSIPVLDRAALDAVKQWLYRPARMRGYLVRVRVTIRVEFRMD
jgi:protein TonB